MADKPQRKVHGRKTFAIKDRLEGAPLAEMLAGLQQQQTMRGRKETYAPIDPTIHPAEYKKPIFTLTDIDALAKIVPDFPSGKIEIQTSDRKQNLTRVQMHRRQAFFRLLNQAVWRYKNIKMPIFIKPKALFKKIEELKDSVGDIHALLNPNEQDEAGRFVIDRLNQMKAPLVQIRLNTGKLRSYCICLEHLLQQHYQRVEATLSKAPRNQGDIPFRLLIDDLLIIWVVIFERDVATSSKKNERTGPLVRFVRAVLAKADIKKSDDTIVKASHRWKRQYGESYKSEKSE
jgi:hypothetical protein